MSDEKKPKQKWEPIFSMYGEGNFYEELNLDTNEKSLEIFIKGIERIIRTSTEYREYIKYLKTEAMLTKCVVMNRLPEEISNSVSIEMHHCPFTLYDLVEIVLKKHLALNLTFTRFSIANEVMNYHFCNQAGIVPLTVTMHQMIHTNVSLVNKNDLFGDYLGFAKQFEKYLSDEQLNKLAKMDRLSDSVIAENREGFLEVDPSLYIDYDDSTKDAVDLPKITKKVKKKSTKSKGSKLSEKFKK